MEEHTPIRSTEFITTLILKVSVIDGSDTQGSYPRWSKTPARSQIQPRYRLSLLPSQADEQAISVVCIIAADLCLRSADAGVRGPQSGIMTGYTHHDA